MDLLKSIKAKAKEAQKLIVLPEADEPRTLKASAIILDEGIARVALLGKKAELDRLAKEYGVDISKADIIDPKDHPKIAAYARELFQLRKHKGMTEDQALEQIQDPMYLAAMMVKSGDADGYVAGARNVTPNVLRPALQIIKSKKGVSSVSGAMIMVLPKQQYGHNGVVLVADCAVNPNPNAEQLAEIAYSSAVTAKKVVGMEPKVAMLSFSTKGSAAHELVDKVAQATQICHDRFPEMEVDGELQFDAAIVPEVAKSKAPGSPVAGKANVFICPDLQSGNISIKIIERLGDAVAIGPILQGIAKPVNDLSRGCSVEDIVNVVAITSAQALCQ